jgi:hypothetical protein
MLLFLGWSYCGAYERAPPRTPITSVSNGRVIAERRTRRGEVRRMAIIGVDAQAGLNATGHDEHEHYGNCRSASAVLSR